MKALDAEQRVRYSALTKKLLGEARSATELAHGFEFRFLANARSISEVAEFVGHERLCCPFIDFQIAVYGDNLSLQLTGPEGAKDFIKAELHVEIH